MKLFKSVGLLSLGVIALTMGGVATSSAVTFEETTGWEITGTNSAGQRIIVSTGTQVGQLNAVTSPATTSATTGNYVTLFGNTLASSNSGATIEFDGPNNVFLNNGTVQGPLEDIPSSQFANTSVGFQSNGSINVEQVINNGNIFGGNGSAEIFEVNTIADTGVAFLAGNGIYNTSINNSDGIYGGSNFIEDGSFPIVALGNGIVLYDGGEIGDINGAYVRNSGVIAGGTNVGDANVVGTGLAMLSRGNVFNFDIVNTSTGLIQGGNNSQAGFVIGSGVVVVAGFENSASINSGTVQNAGTILGGNSAFHSGFTQGNLSVAGSGVVFWGANGVYNVTVNNSGLIAGGQGQDEEVGEDQTADQNFGSVASTGLAIFDASREGTNINGISITNSGTISGGNNAAYAYVVGSGVGIAGVGNVFNVAVTNTSTGAMIGGNNNEGSNEFGGPAVAGTGLGIAAGINSGNFNINGFAIGNAGTITGGNGNSGAYVVGSGIGIWSSNGIYNGVVANSGLVAGGNGNTNGQLQGVGIGLLDNGLPASINSVSVLNSGIVTGGNSNGDRGRANVAGVGIAVVGEGIVNYVYINNSGIVTGGNGNFDANYMGDGIVVSSNFEATRDVLIDNSGAVFGGSSTSGGGDAIQVGTLRGEGNPGGNFLINNYGIVIGGNGLNGSTAGEGIRTIGSNVTVNNYGLVAAGGGAVQGGLPSGFPAVAISVSGSNNTINLNGHSAVLGTLQGANGTNNVLNLNFTGLSPQDIANIKSQLANQGWPGTNDFTGTFTVRGVTYYVDPLLINLNLSSYGGQGLTWNQIQVGNNLDSLTVNPTGGLLALVNAIDASGNVPMALEQLSPQPYQIYGDIAEATANFMTLSIDERLNNLRDGSESIDTTGIGGTTDHTTTAGYDKDGKTVVVPEAKSLQKQWGFFAQGSGLFSSIDAHGGDLSNQGFTTSGLILGMDGKVNDHLVLGTLFNFDYTVADLDSGGSKANVQTLGGGLYAGYHNEGWYGNGLAAWGSNDYNSNRNIIFPGFTNSALAETHGNQESVNIDGGYDFHMLDNKLTFGPIAGLQYVHLDVNGFNEGGAGAADLAVGDQNVDSLRSRFGFRADYHTQIAKEVAFATEIRAAWQHEFLDDRRIISADFIGSGLVPFGVQTTEPQRDAALVGVGANFTVRDTMTLFFDYDVQAGQQSYLEQSVKGGIKLSF